MITDGVSPPCAKHIVRHVARAPQQKMTPVSIFCFWCAEKADFPKGNRFPYGKSRSEKGACVADVRKRERGFSCPSERGGGLRLVPVWESESDARFGLGRRGHGLALAAIVCAAVAVTASVGLASADDEHSLSAATKSATGRFHNLEAAKGAGYSLLRDAAGIACIDNQPVGGARRCDFSYNKANPGRRGRCSRRGMGSRRRGRPI